MKKKYALISLYNKENIEQICNALIKYKINIIATNSTSTYINKCGFKCYRLDNFTKFHEILDGRVKTLHPKIHASILFDRQDISHIKKIKKMSFPIIDFVIVNLYPFKKFSNNTANFKKSIEMIDVGGVTLLRSASKNYNFVTPICDVNDYKKFILNLKKNVGKTSLQFRKKMAAKTFETTSNYDSLIFKWMLNKENYSSKFIQYEKQALQYGENPHQKSFYYKNSKQKLLFDNIIPKGKELTYNNLLDVDSAYNCITEFSEPTCAIIKHNNPCGVASSNKIYNAFLRAYSSDSKSAFGGVVALNKAVNHELAKKITSSFFTIIIAPKFTKKAKVIFEKKRNLVLIETRNITNNSKTDVRSIHGGYLIQEKNLIVLNKKDIKCATKKKASKKQIDDLIFSFKVCKHIKSNAIVLSKDKKTLGIGAGQMSRIDATKLSLSKIRLDKRKKGFVAASDAFFPFTDNIKLLLKNNCETIIQPKGSINDFKIVSFANKNNLPLYFSKYRFFKH